MAYVYDFIVLLIWTAICAAFVYGLERLLEMVGYRPQVTDVEPENHIPPLPPG